MTFQWKVIFLLAFAVANIASDSAELEEDPTCVLNYLQDNKIITGRFRGFRASKSNTRQTDDACSTKVELFQNNIYEELLILLKRESDTEPIADCIVDQLKTMNYGDLELKKLFYERAKTVSKRKRKNLLKAVDLSIDKKLEISIKICSPESIFGELFDELYNNANQTAVSENDESDYCLKKHLSDTNFYDKSLYNVNINPKNIDISQVNCDDEYTFAVEEFEDAFAEEFQIEMRRASKATKTCIRNAVRNSNSLEHNLFAVVLGEIGATDEQKNRERTKYINAMERMYSQLMKCHY